MQQVRPSRTKRSARWPNLCCHKQKMEAMHPRAASLLSGRVRRIRIKPRKNSLYPLKRHRSLPAPAPEDKPTPTPTPAPTQKPAEKQGEQPAPKPEPAPTPKPAASGNIYSIAEAIRAGNEYARAQCGVTIDTGLTAENTSYFPGTADSVAWLAGRRH